MATSQPINSLYDWVGELYQRIYFQEDEDVFHSACQTGLSSTVRVRINQQVFDKAGYVEEVRSLRSQFSFIRKDGTELSHQLNDEHSQQGAVSQRLAFIMKDKKTGEELQFSSVLITFLTQQNGQWVLEEMVEVMA